MKASNALIICAVIIAVVVITAAIFVYLPQESKNPENAKQTVKIGVLAPLTGPVSLCGEDMQTGLEVAKELINKDAEKNFKVELIYEDDQFNNALAVSGVKRLINEEGVKAIIGSCSSSATLAVAPITEESKIILFTPISFADSISNAGDFVFRNAPLAKELAPPMIEKLRDSNVSRLAILYLNNDYGISLKDNLKANAARLGLEIMAEESYEASSSDFRTQLAKIKESNAEALAFASVVNSAPLVVKQARTLGLDVLLITNNTVEHESFFNALGRDGIKGILVASLVDFSEKTLSENSWAKKFFEAFRSKYPGKIADTKRAASFDSLMLISKAIEECKGDSNTECLKNSLYGIKGYLGVEGKFSINEFGDAVHEKVIIKNAEDIIAENAQ